MECNICCEEQKEFVSCLNCKHAACVTCSAKYLLDNLAPACMSCKEPWSDDYIRRSFPLKWVEGKWKDHCKKVLLDQERSWMPGTQELAKRLTAAYTQHKRFWKDMDAKGREDLKARHDIAQSQYVAELAKQAYEAKQKCESGVQPSKIKYVIPVNNGWVFDDSNFKQDWMRQTGLEDVVDDFKQMTMSKNAWPPKPSMRDLNETHPVKFHKACPVNDCRGFLSTEWKCGICSTAVCKECHFPRAADHKCNPDHVKSAKVIDETTKPCPRCAAAVFKTEGCNHMWCTACNTGFSWLTGETIQNNRNTNPYFYQWLHTAEGRQAFGTEVGALRTELPQRGDCVRVNMLWLKGKFLEYARKPRPWHSIKNILIHASTFINEFDTNEFRQFHLTTDNPTYGPRVNEIPRAKFLAGLMTEKEFLTQAMKNKKRIDYEKELRDLYATTCNILNDWVIMLIDGGGSQDEIIAKRGQWKTICEFFTANSKALAELYGYKIHPVLNLNVEAQNDRMTWHRLSPSFLTMEPITGGL